jgi:ABC-type uncharacterized transport system substrate-binding protein
MTSIRAQGLSDARPTTIQALLIQGLLRPSWINGNSRVSTPLACTMRGVTCDGWWKPIFHRFVSAIMGLAGLVAATASAFAHPHVWVTMHTELHYGSDGSVTAVRHSWMFDDMFSAFAITGLRKTNGTFPPATLQALAKVNVESLKEYKYFTYAKVDGIWRKDAFNDPTPGYWLDYDPKATVLTLHFTLPFKTAVKAKLLQIEIYDPEFFIDFGFARKNPVTLVGAPAQCKMAAGKPPDSFFPPLFSKLDQSFATSEANVGMGASFANKITVTCP